MMEGWKKNYLHYYSKLLTRCKLVVRLPVTGLAPASAVVVGAVGSLAWRARLVAALVVGGVVVGNLSVS